MGLETARYYTFEEWMAQNIELIEELERDLCPECGGDGECDCPECGHLTICPECDGDGYLGPSPHEVYEKQLENDKRKVEEFLQLFGRAS